MQLTGVAPLQQAWECNVQEQMAKTNSVWCKRWLLRAERELRHTYGAGPPLQLFLSHLWVHALGQQAFWPLKKTRCSRICCSGGLAVPWKQQDVTSLWSTARSTHQTWNTSQGRGCVDHNHLLVGKMKLPHLRDGHWEVDFNKFILKAKLQRIKMFTINFQGKPSKYTSSHLNLFQTTSHISFYNHW